MRTASTLFALVLAVSLLPGCSEKSDTLSPSAGTADNVAIVRTSAEGDVVPGSWIIVLSSDLQQDEAASSEKLERMLRDLSDDYTFKITNRYASALLGFAAHMDDKTAARLAQDPRIEMIEQDRYSHAFVQSTPTGIGRIDADISSTLAGNGSGSVSGVDCYIIDTGIMPTHTDLNVVGGANFVTGSTSWADGHGHGTHVAGTVAAKDNSAYVVGVAPGADLYAVRVLDNNGSGQNSWIIAGINWVASQKAANPTRPMVANMSLGGYAGSTAYNTMDIAVRNTITAGVPFAIAAGNSSANASLYTPAHVTEAITVGAYDPSNNRFATFSNYGSVVDINAPGVNTVSTYKNGGTATMSGTSMASPHVAGTIALYLSTNPAATPAAVRTALISAANAPVGSNPAITRVKPQTTTLSVYAGNF